MSSGCAAITSPSCQSSGTASTAAPFVLQTCQVVLVTSRYCLVQQVSAEDHGAEYEKADQVVEQGAEDGEADPHHRDDSYDLPEHWVLPPSMPAASAPDSVCSVRLDPDSSGDEKQQVSTDIRERSGDTRRRTPVWPGASADGSVTRGTSSRLRLYGFTVRSEG